MSEKKFIVRKATLRGRSVEYRFNDQPILLLKGKLRMRQVIRLSDNSHQAPILTSRLDLRDIVVACRMFERCRQVDFFKYLRGEYATNALVDYQVDPDDPSRSVPNPAWKDSRRSPQPSGSGTPSTENLSASSGWLLKASSIMRADAATPRIS
ncbi:MAG: hypothetical protein IMZ62_07255 [Chloroflexi bacterium]|nr:hypothetical protein [Chloroflexota bacterium]